ncbi:hypothetical protein ONS95_009313 [Cadophora gregata]|uniref:uncharacterized protein n=1 Tax=Cadophora gregata TaxID=51156 RepID=UPI0026DCC3FE|nr:uncharacterized protein ONS95_009313 [Cadophora gregata]KAK0124344.1 hypothetical protein ONS95_009313 [Cadophora gregata]KAK0129801.1 hypothetical protein ONS96_000353 [Cadophora gregata f. sp. sojae]
MEHVTSTITKQAAEEPFCPPNPHRRPHISITSSSSSSSSLGAFTSASSSGISTPTSLTPSSPSTPTEFKPHPKYNCHVPQLCPKTGHKIDVLQRSFPKPKEEVNIEEALARGPLPGRYARERVVREETVEQKMSEFERVKRELRGLKEF